MSLCKNIRRNSTSFDTIWKKKISFILPLFYKNSVKLQKYVGRNKALWYNITKCDILYLHLEVVYLLDSLLNKIIMNVAGFATFIASTVVTSACIWWAYQPEEPKTLRYEEN